MEFIVRECRSWLEMAVILREPPRVLKYMLLACNDVDEERFRFPVAMISKFSHSGSCQRVYILMPREPH
jgi:hypothetical protein